MNSTFRSMVVLLLSCACLRSHCAAEEHGAMSAVAFPGNAPGKASASQQGDVLTLENDVIAAQWRATDGVLRPVQVINKITGSRFAQEDSEIFRLAVNDAGTKPAPGFAVTIRLDAERIVALVSRDGVVWKELAAFPRSNFPGEPRLVRIGKMDPHGQAKSYSTDGPMGKCSISELSPRPASVAGGRLDLTLTAHEAKTVEYPFPTGSAAISCRIDKGTDQGLSWGPALALIWEDGTRFVTVGVRDAKNEGRPVLTIFTAAGERIVDASLAVYAAFDHPASAFRFATAPRPIRVAGDPRGVRIAEHLDGMAIDGEAVDQQGLRVHWRAELRDGSHYIRQQVTLSADRATMPLTGVELMDLRIPGLATVGTVPGCPVAGNGFFAGVEIPGAQNATGDTGARSGFSCKLVLSAGNPYSFASVMGVAPAGQLRRSFLSYVERERARPSQPFLHYNGWYDLGYDVDEQRLIEVVKQYHAELVVRRGIPVQSYLIDDGWDSVRAGLWAENPERFPRGFVGTRAAMNALDSRLGIWISPLGGYSGDKERLALARSMKLLPADSGFDLSQPAYKAWFQDRCIQLMRQAGVNCFKWDKAGEGVSPHFMALLDVAHALRAVDPTVFINVTVGTWPSPFWLNHVDCTWRDGTADVGWEGKSDDATHDSASDAYKYNRERWLTFRDGSCRGSFVERSPLYPLNSVMHSGIVYGREFQGGSIAKNNPPRLRNEARSYFASGATLQELYLSPSLMTADAWDQVAEAARWAHGNADVLVDAHWVGGDPFKLQAYGYAAWNPRQGTLMLRNPDDRRQPLALDAATVFELPKGAPLRYRLRAPYKDQRVQDAELRAGALTSIDLAPFEVLVFDAMPE